MCGLAGVFSFDGKPVEEGLLLRMRESMIHRGPDGAGLWVSDDRRVGLVHRRLAIVDLSDAAAQPMTNADATLRIVFNGEIYNHAEIRRELEKTGKYRWKTDHSDTEVILHAYAEWGLDCLQHFRGMFAIALWDERKQELLLIRDRIGVKPLYFARRDGRILFASEIKALLEDPGQPRRLNETALYHFLSFMTSPAPDTLFDGIHKLPPATWMKVRRDGAVTSAAYWDVWDHTQPLTRESEEDIAHRLLEELRTSVNLRKVSDVPVGVFLSGGIDSSTNAALFSEGKKTPVRTFSIGYDGDYASYQNELHHARAMAERVNARHAERKLSLDDLLDFLPSLVHHQDEPIADPVCVPVYYVSKLARDNGVIVCQVGEGADELFCGYPSWRTLIQLQEWGNIPGLGALKRLGAAALQAAGRDNALYYERLRRSARGEPIFWSGAETFGEAEKRRLLSPRLRRRFEGYSSYEAVRPFYQRFQEKAWEKTPLQWMGYADLKLRLPELLLMRVDKMSMAASVEGRVPFLDHKFVELAMSIPQKIKIKNGTLKHILKKAVRGVIPDAIIDRPKQGFGVPIHDWFFQRLGDEARRAIGEFCDATDCLDKTYIDGLFRQRKSVRLWTLFNLSLWWKHHFAGAAARPARLAAAR